MGRLIDIDVLFDYFGNDAINETTRSNIEYFVNEEGTVEAIPKDQYENRLKADMAAMLTEIQLEIEETAKDAHINAFMNGYKDMYLNGISASAIKCSEIIQQKINSLKEGT